MKYQNDWATTKNNDGSIDPWVLFSQLNSLKYSLRQVENLLQIKLGAKKLKKTVSVSLPVKKIKFSEKEIHKAKSLWEQEWEKEWRAWNALRH